MNTVRDYIRANPYDNSVSMREWSRKHSKEYTRITGRHCHPEYFRKKLRHELDAQEKFTAATSTKSTDCRVLVLDIETAPLKAYVWSMWKQNIRADFMLSDWFMLTWSAKWLFDDKIMSDRLTKEEVLQEDDGRISQSIWELIDKADVIIAHNLKKFDLKRLNTRFLKNGLYHPSPYQTIDTLLHARKEFSITSNRLDYIAKFLGCEGKMETSPGMWQKCSQGDEEALKDMEQYNIKDILVLEEVYLRLRPYMRSHPNIGLHLIASGECCPSCGSDELEEVGEYNTAVNSYTALRCKCGALSRRRHGRLTVKEREHIIQSVAR